MKPALHSTQESHLCWGINRLTNLRKKKQAKYFMDNSHNTQLDLIKPINKTHQSPVAKKKRSKEKTGEQTNANTCGFDTTLSDLYAEQPRPAFIQQSHRKRLRHLQSGNFTAADIKLTIQAAILHLSTGNCNPFKMAASCAACELTETL